MVNPRLYLDRLTAAVQLAAMRSLLAEVITLADQAGWITDSALRTRLSSLAVRAGQVRNPHRSNPAESPVHNPAATAD